MAAGSGPEVPEDMAGDPVQSEAWRALAEAGGLGPSDVPAMRLLCYWHAVADAAQEAMGRSSPEVVEGDGPGARRHPAVSVLKDASAEIRLLSEMLGAVPSARGGQAERADGGNARLLSVMFSERRAREGRAEAR